MAVGVWSDMVRFGTAGFGKAVLASYGLARKAWHCEFWQGGQVKVRRGAVWSGAVGLGGSGELR